MKRLNIELPEFTRVVWASDRAREVWHPIFERIVRAWWDIEWLSVSHGVRSCGLTMVTPDELVSKAGDWVKNGMTNLPLAVQRFPYKELGSGPIPKDSEIPFIFRVVVGRPEHVVQFKEAWDSGDNEVIGNLLGSPSCCMDFFFESAGQHAFTDSTWPMATGRFCSDETFVDISGPPEANMLWRSLGLRPVPHQPCSFHCDSTVDLGRKMFEVGRSAGFREEMDRLTEILSWPVEWSALHGIAEIKTPVLKILTRTDATSCKYVVRRQGSSYPSEGADGLAFPYRIRAQSVPAPGSCTR